MKKLNMGMWWRVLALGPAAPDAMDRPILPERAPRLTFHCSIGNIAPAFTHVALLWRRHDNRTHMVNPDSQFGGRAMHVRIGHWIGKRRVFPNVETRRNRPINF